MCEHASPSCKELRDNARQGSGFAVTLLRKRHPSEFRPVLSDEEKAARKDAREIVKFMDNLMITGIEVPDKPE